MFGEKRRHLAKQAPMNTVDDKLGSGSRMPKIGGRQCTRKTGRESVLAAPTILPSIGTMLAVHLHVHPKRNYWGVNKANEA